MMRRILLAGALLVALTIGITSSAGARRQAAGPSLLRYFGPIVVDERAGHAFVLAYNQGRSGSQIAMFDAGTGVLLHVTPSGEFMFKPNAASSSVSVLDTHAGTLLRTVALGGNPATLGLDRRRGRVFVMNLGTLIPPKICIRGCTVHYVGNSSITVLDAHDGSILHTLPVGGVPISMAVDELHGRILVARSDRRVVVLDTTRF